MATKLSDERDYDARLRQEEIAFAREDYESMKKTSIWQATSEALKECGLKTVSLSEERQTHTGWELNFEGIIPNEKIRTQLRELIGKKMHVHPDVFRIIAFYY